MPNHEVQQGDSLSRIARKYGFVDWKQIYNDPKNEEFRKKRPNPNVIFPGDVVWIPEKQENGRDVSTGKRHTFRVPVAKRILRLRFLDALGEPLANEALTFTVQGKPPVRNKRTDSDGRVEFAVSPDDSGAVINIAERERLLEFSYLNPVRDTPDEGVSGIQARLYNLGYFNGQITGTLDRATAVALAVFQFDHELEMTGDPDDGTLAKLEEAHGC
jgi:N-acetylmuramoyl-L-alanine amidase